MEIELENLLFELERMNLEEKVNAINEIKLALHEISPFNTEPS